MILTNCSHNFCSLCIRQALQEQSTADKTCPQCRAPCSTVTQLKANRVVDELVRLVRAVRKQTIEALEGVASGSGSASAKTLEDRVSASVSAKTRKHGVDADTSTASKKRKTMMTAASQDATTLPSRRYPVRQRASASQGNVATVVDEEQDVSPHPATPVMTATRRRTSVTPIAVHVDDETTASEDDDDDAASATAMTQPEEIVLDAKQCRWWP